MLKKFKLFDCHPETATRHQAVAGGTVIAESDSTQRVEGNHYFPPESVNWELLERSDHISFCPWKGQASYYDVVTGEDRLRAAAWTYETPSLAAAHIKGHVAFWRGVRVTSR